MPKRDETPDGTTESALTGSGSDAPKQIGVKRSVGDMKAEVAGSASLELHCRFCGKAYGHEARLTTHIEKTHGDDVEKVCTVKTTDSHPRRCGRCAQRRVMWDFFL